LDKQFRSLFQSREKIKAHNLLIRKDQNRSVKDELFRIYTPFSNGIFQSLATGTSICQPLVMQYTWQVDATAERFCLAGIFSYDKQHHLQFLLLTDFSTHL